MVQIYEKDTERNSRMLFRIDFLFEFYNMKFTRKQFSVRMTFNATLLYYNGIARGGAIRKWQATRRDS